ncbi:MAG: hypothetical protein EBS85_01155 [Micrococcales bacterium]|nr:hypothetical protein [Actinomycetota bacterium]NCA07326.1 hypothetical protein [Micrococcales bacterium]
MNPVFVYVFSALGVLGLIAFVITGFKLVSSSKRISRSIDPITQKISNLRLEVSALKRSRLERQRRLESSGSNHQKPTK